MDQQFACCFVPLQLEHDFLMGKERQSALAGLVSTLLYSVWIAFRIVSKQAVIVMLFFDLILKMV